MTLQAEYIATQNVPPEPGGDIQLTSSITEDGGEQAVTVFGILLQDPDKQPTQIKIIDFTGGTPMLDGAPLVDADSNQTPLSAINGNASFSFEPDQNFSGTALVEYVVIDPDVAATSAPSTISIPVAPVNDTPTLQSSGQPVTIRVFSTCSIAYRLTMNDIDSSKISEIRLETSLVDGDVIVVPDLYGFSAQSNSGGTIVISGSNNITLKNARDYIAQLKFYSTSENLIDPTTGQDRSLSVKVRVADDEGELSSEVEKVVSFIDINDAPEFTWTAVDQVASITENGAGLTVATLGDLLDQGDLISELTVEISQGYSAAFDSLDVTDAVAGDAESPLHLIGSRVSNIYFYGHNGSFGIRLYGPSWWRYL